LEMDWNWWWRFGILPCFGNWILLLYKVSIE
jgi:hypothetical protein